MSRRHRTLALLASTALLVGCSSSYHAGDQASREWAAWAKDHPIAGARVTDAVGTNVQPFRGTFEAYARLTATPSEETIVKAMASMCRFDQETSSRTTYWLQIDRVSLQAPCDLEDQHYIAEFWSTVNRLPGIEELAFSTKGIALTADDAEIFSLAQVVSEAADETGHAAGTSVNDYTSPHVSITQSKGVDFSTELGLAKGVLDTAGSAVKAIRVVRGRVSASTSGTVAQAQDWQQRVGQGSPVLTVTPNKVTTELPFTARGRDLVERLSEDPRTTAVSVAKPFWAIGTKTTKSARGLIDFLDYEPGTKDLGQLQLDVGTTHYDSATGSGRSCYIRPVFPETNGRAAALLNLCDVPNAVNVDDRFDAALDLRLHGNDLDHAGLPGALACLRRLPFGQPVYLQLPQNDTIEFSTGEELVAEFPDSALAQRLAKIWDALPVRASS
jgi:hypothetical protein